MKNKKNYIILIIIILLLVIIIISSKNKLIKQQIDLIVFETVNFKKMNKEKDKDKKEIEINISNKENEKEIEFFKMINNNIKIKEKIYPGTKGDFDIILSSSKTRKYEIEIIDQNRRPKNLEIHFEKNGTIRKKEIKKVKINWEWKYQTDKEGGDQEDTKAGKEIEKYCFKIKVKEID